MRPDLEDVCCSRGATTTEQWYESDGSGDGQLTGD